MPPCRKRRSLLATPTIIARGAAAPRLIRACGAGGAGHAGAGGNMGGERAGGRVGRETGAGGKRAADSDGARGTLQARTRGVAGAGSARDGRGREAGGGLGRGARHAAGSDARRARGGKRAANSGGARGTQPGIGQRQTPLAAISSSVPRARDHSARPSRAFSQVAIFAAAHDSAKEAEGGGFPSEHSTKWPRTRSRVAQTTPEGWPARGGWPIIEAE